MSIISKAYAEGAAPGAQGGGMEMIIMLAVFGLIFYFMIYRPQAKRAKTHRDLMSSLAKLTKCSPPVAWLARLPRCPPIATTSCWP